MSRALTFLVAVAATSAVVATNSFAPGEGQTPAPAQAAQPARPQGNDGGLTPAPNRRADEGRGPFKSLVIRGVMLIDGSGAPPQGPVDVVVSGNRISSVRSAGTPGLALRTNRAPQNADLEVDATGMYLLPGFVDMHVHAGGAPKNADAEYAYKLWLGHGVTTVRGVPLGSNSVTVGDKLRSEKNEIVAPRIYNYQRPGSGWDKGQVATPEQAREYVRWAAANGIDGLKLGAERPDIMAALLDEAKKVGFGIDRAPAAGRRRADERDQGRATRPQQRDALLRPLRVTAEGLRRAAVADRHERERRAVALRPGRAPVEQDPRAGFARVEGLPRRAREARHGVRSDLDHLLGRPRPHEVPQRRVARQVHAAVAHGLLRAQPLQSRRLLVSTGRPKTKSSGGTSTRCGSSC